MHKSYDSLSAMLKRVTLNLDAQKLKRQALKWAKKFERKTGMKVTQPQSAFVRALIDRDAKGAK